MKPYKLMIPLALVATIFLVSPVFGTPSSSPVNSYSRLASKIRPSVVTILVYDYGGQLKQIGSGFFYNKKGDIITNSHVLTPNCRAEIKTSSGKKYPVGGIIQRNEKNDFVKAHTHIPQKSPWLAIAKKPPRVGDEVMVAGSPMGLEQTISEGIVSAWRKLPPKGKVLQISAPVSRGSSGGPVMNMAGEVVGIATFQMVNGQNLNFAIPVSAIFSKPEAKQKKLKIHKDKKGAIIISD
ncbi:MAG: serine protease [Desulfobacterium sp.]|nr:serine protease [Desulfobacterium sp.]